MAKPGKAKSDQEHLSFRKIFFEICIAIINKGQAPAVLVVLLFALMILKMDSQNVSELSKNIVEGIKDYSLAGHILAGIFLIGWVVTLKYQRRSINNEMKRMGIEKRKYQEKALNKKLPSSDKS